MRIDLHTHSSHSDGTGTPTDVVREAAEAGLDVVALTDHDTASGWEEAHAAGLDHGVTVIPGVEVSCRSRGHSVHVLAYLVDPQGEEFRHELQRARDARTERLVKMADLLIRDGYLGSFEDVLQHVDERATWGRPHLADALVARGHYVSRDEAFTGVLSADSPYYVGHYAPDPVRAVEVIRTAGGVPVLAHPLAGSRGQVVGEAVIDAMAAAGLAGLEADHRDHTTADRARAKEIAARLGLLITGSSDYHGTGKPNRLGENTTTRRAFESILEQGSGARPMGAALAA